MKRKLIEVYQENLIICDNPKCDFVVKNPTGKLGEDSSMYMNVACPQCGDNLLTEQDHLQFLKMLRIINWINKWFSWAAIFTKKQKDFSGYIHVHKGVHIHDMPHTVPPHTLPDEAVKEGR